MNEPPAADVSGENGEAGERRPESRRAWARRSCPPVRPRKIREGARRRGSRRSTAATRSRARRTRRNPWAYSRASLGAGGRKRKLLLRYGATSGARRLGTVGLRTPDRGRRDELDRSGRDRRRRGGRADHVRRGPRRRAFGWSRSPSMGGGTGSRSSGSSPHRRRRARPRQRTNRHLTRSTASSSGRRA